MEEPGLDHLRAGIQRLEAAGDDAAKLARALYLTTNGVDYGYRIRGTPEWETIGQNASSGCIRMLNQDVMDLYNRVPDGTRVVVLTEDGRFPTRLNVPPVPAVKKPAPPPPPPPPGVDDGPIYGPI